MNVAKLVHLNDTCILVINVKNKITGKSLWKLKSRGFTLSRGLFFKIYNLTTIININGFKHILNNDINTLKSIDCKIEIITKKVA